MSSQTDSGTCCNCGDSKYRLVLCLEHAWGWKYKSWNFDTHQLIVNWFRSTVCNLPLVKL